LYEGGCNALVIETMSDMDEALAAVKACKENTPAEVICTMTFEKTAENTFYTMMGVSPEEMTRQLVSAGADIIGANCGNGMQNMIGIIKEIRRFDASIPILIHANAGTPLYKDGKTIFPENPMQMAEYLDELIDSGAGIIGGCCGTTPDHIRTFAEIVRKKY